MFKNIENIILYYIILFYFERQKYKILSNFECVFDKLRNKSTRYKTKKSFIDNTKIKIKKLLCVEILYFFINILIQVKSYSEITLTIKGKGTQQIIHEKIDRPNEIYVNDILYNDTNYYSVNNLINEINNITIKWNN